MVDISRRKVADFLTKEYVLCFVHYTCMWKVLHEALVDKHKLCQVSDSKWLLVARKQENQLMLVPYLLCAV